MENRPIEIWEVEITRYGKLLVQCGFVISDILPSIYVSNSVASVAATWRPVSNVSPSNENWGHLRHLESPSTRLRPRTLRRLGKVSVTNESVSLRLYHHHHLIAS